MQPDPAKPAPCRVAPRLPFRGRALRPCRPARGRSPPRPPPAGLRAALGLCLALGSVLGACGTEPLGEGLAVPVSVDLVRLVDAGDARVTVITEHPEHRVQTVPPRLDPADPLQLAVEDWGKVVWAQPESAFEIALEDVGDSPSLYVRTMVYSAFRTDPARADPWPATFRILVDGEERAALRSDYINEPAEHPYDQVMRTILVDLADKAHRPVTLRFETTRAGAPPPEGDFVEANPLWFEIQLRQEVKVARQKSSPDRPHLLVLNVDTLAARRTSLHGYDRDTTPVLARLAREGTVFTRAMSPSSWTLPATASLFTGLPANTHGVLGDMRSYLMDGLMTLPELLREEGIEGAAFIANALISEGNNFDQGFDTWVQANDVPAAELNQELLTWIDARPGDDRWFAYVHYFDPHAPYGAPGEARDAFTGDYSERRSFAGHLPNLLQNDLIPPLAPDEQRHVIDLYDGEVAYFDRCLGELLGALEERGLMDRTLIVLTSDHGEELFEHGQLGHGYALHEVLLHVPLVIVGPKIPAGRRVDDAVGTERLFNTLLQLGAASPIEGAADRLPLAPDAAPPRGDVYATTRTLLFGPQLTLMSGRDRAGRKVVGALAAEGGDVAWTLHDLDRDPQEGSALDPDDLSPTERAAFDGLTRRTLAWYEESARRRPPEPQARNPDIREALGAVGYLGTEDDEALDEDPVGTDESADPAATGEAHGRGGGR